VRHEAKHVANRIGIANDIVTENGGGSRRRRQKRGQDAQSSCLAGAVGAYKAEKNAAVDRQIEARKGRDRPVHAGESVRLNSRKDRKSTRLNSSHGSISYAVFCLKKKSQSSGGEKINPCLKALSARAQHQNKPRRETRPEL